LDSPANLSGKVCLVTGATSGIGSVAAEALARQGATVCVVGRSREKCEATVDRIRRETGNRSVEFLIADLSVQAEIRRLADEFRKNYGRLDVLVNNAGGMFLDRRESDDGIEMTFALNHLAYFLLTDLLLDLLKASVPARVVSVSSDAHRWPRRIDLDDYQGRKRFGGLRAYGQSKLANVLFTAELARRLAGTGVTANALHPGFVATGFFAGRGMAGMTGRLMGTSARLFAIGPEEGAKTTIFLASAPELERVLGEYFYRCKSIRPSAAARDAAAARKLWELSESLTRPGVGA
jgi:NAD(P)-dependent dehydrogenase (short-subunit alcohol dehydrogenase family)